jgi:hypothetical protein
LPFLLAIVAEQNPASCLCQQSPYCKISIHPDIRGVLTNIKIEGIGKGEPNIVVPDAEAIQILKDCRRRVATDS